MRFSAALSLARLGPVAEAAVPALGDALRDSNLYVLGYAVEALDRIGTQQAADAGALSQERPLVCPDLAREHLLMTSVNEGISGASMRAGREAAP